MIATIFNSWDTKFRWRATFNVKIDGGAEDQVRPRQGGEGEGGGGRNKNVTKEGVVDEEEQCQRQ